MFLELINNMNIKTFLRINTVILAIIAANFLLPIFTALYYGENEIIPCFLFPMLATWLLAVLVHVFFHKQKLNLSVRASFVVVAFAWIDCAILGALPLMLSYVIPS